MSQFECNNWIALEHPEIQHGYKQNMSSKYHDFSNYSTFKVAQYIFGYEDFREKLVGTEVSPGTRIKTDDLRDSITNVLAGIHFNSGRELKEYIMKYQPLESLKPSEYSYVNWNEIWAQMGHENEFGLAADIGLTGSWYEQAVKENPEYSDLISKINTEEPVTKPEERVRLKIENSKIILHSFLIKMGELRGNKNLLPQFEEVKANVKRVVIDLYHTCHRFPITGDALVDSYLNRCKLA